MYIKILQEKISLLLVLLWRNVNNRRNFEYDFHPYKIINFHHHPVFQENRSKQYYNKVRR